MTFHEASWAATHRQVDPNGVGWPGGLILGDAPICCCPPWGQPPRPLGRFWGQTVGVFAPVEHGGVWRLNVRIGHPDGYLHRDGYLHQDGGEARDGATRPPKFGGTRRCMQRCPPGRLCRPHAEHLGPRSDKADGLEHASAPRRRRGSTGGGWQGVESVVEAVLSSCSWTWPALPYVGY